MAAAGRRAVAARALVLMAVCCACWLPRAGAQRGGKSLSQWLANRQERMHRPQPSESVPEQAPVAQEELPEPAPPPPKSLPSKDPSNYDFRPKPKERYLRRVDDLFQHFTELHPLARRLDVEAIKSTCVARKMPDICLILELQGGLDAMLASAYHVDDVHRMLAAPAVLESHQLAPRAPHAKSQHASTVAEVAPGELLASWFSGTWEAAEDTGIWMARYQDGEWGEPWEVVPHEGNPPLWNPVLLQVPRTGETILFYKEGTDPLIWAGKLIRSRDGGRTWGAPELLPQGIVGPAKNKPIVLPDGTILSPSSEELGPGEFRQVGNESTWFVHMEVSKDDGRSWTRSQRVRFDGNIIQPALFVDSADNVRMLARMTSNTVKHADFDEDWHYPRHYLYNNSNIIMGVSDKNGVLYHDVRHTSLPCPNSGIDAVRLLDGRVLTVYNPTKYNYRAVLAVAVSEDDGETWYNALDLERFRKVDMVDKGWTRYPEYSYPAVIQAADGMVHITYTYSIMPLKRHKCGREYIKHVVVNPLKLQPIKLEQQEVNAKDFHHYLQAVTAKKNYIPQMYEHWLNGNNGVRTHITFDDDGQE